MDYTAINTIGALRGSGWVDRSVKDELRDNLMQRMRAGAELFPGIVGFDQTVIPALERAILAGHDIIMLGERGQAKTRLIRRLVDLLDAHSPTIDGCEINDSPFRPVCAACLATVASEGDLTPIRWVTPEARYGEKLATPDTAVGDLIGDVDPIKVAEGRYLADQLTIHYGLVPRSHRGIFSINELPDLPTRIQVSLLNVLEERDIQIRGYRVNLPLDILLIASANPEDYTNRGRIITPLKDRFGSEVRTHYPLTIEDEIAIMEQEAAPPPPGVEVAVPTFLKEILAELTHAVRSSSHINQRSGVSVRFSIANLETLVASTVRRALRVGNGAAVARVADLPSVLLASLGRIEFEVFEEGREMDVLRRLLAQAVVEVFRDHSYGVEFTDLLDVFEDGAIIESGDLVPSEAMLSSVAGLEVLTEFARRIGVTEESPHHLASVLDFALEGLHLTRRLNKDGEAGSSLYGLG